MNNSKRVILNSFILYSKIIITMSISLISVPMILNALGKSDYGLYNLVAGIIFMLSFLNASMSVTTQRYLSVAIGENSIKKLNDIYNTSLILHLIIGIVIVLFFEIASLFIFNGFLNIPNERICATKIVYQFIVLSTFLTIISVPFSALINAKENMLVFSIIGIIDSLLKLLLAFYLTKSSYDRLIVYGAGMAVISFVGVLFNFVYVKIKYQEFTINVRRYFNKNYFYKMFGFASWNTLGAIAVIGRNQGVAIIFNLFCGTVANAAYAIANQINGVLGYFSSTFQKSLNPQLMQSEGIKDRERLIRLSIISSKYSVWVLSLFAVPLIIEMPYVLKLWIKNVPEYTIKLSQFVLIFAIVYQYSVGIMSAIQAIGKIKRYFIIISILIIFNLPICYYILKIGAPLYYCIIVFIIIEIISLNVRLFMANKLVGIKFGEFLRKVVKPTFLNILLGIIFVLPFHCLLQESFLRLLFVGGLYLIIYFVFAYYFVFDSNIKSMIISIKYRLKRKIKAIIMLSK